MNKFCNFCWAKLYGGGCHITDVNRRIVECEKAKAQSEKTTSVNKTQGLRDYIDYISKRVRYLKLFQGIVEFSEYKYYCELKKQINMWGRKHAIFYAYLRKKIDLRTFAELYGLSERETYRLIGLQQRRLIKFIEAQEEILCQKYPFIPMKDVFCEE